MISSAWVGFVREEQGEMLQTEFQQAITACSAAGQ